jgi:tetratricopeptide (TPR) repeat protein
VVFYRSAHESGLDDPRFIDKYSRSLVRSNRSDEAQTILEKALAKATDPGHKARLSVATAFLQDWMGSLEEVRQYCEAAIGFLSVSDSHNKDILAEARILLGKSYWKQRRFEEALGDITIGLGIYKELKDPTGISDALNTMGSVYYHKGNFDKALDCYARSNKAKERSGYYNNAGLIKWAQGKLGEAEDLFKTALKKSMAMGSFIDIPRIQLNLADLALESSDFSKARIWLDLTEKSIEDVNNKVLAPQTVLMRARIAFMEGDLDKATELIQSIRPVLIQKKMVSVELFCNRLEGVIAAARGDYKASKNLLVKVAERFRKLGMQYELACVLVNLAQTLQGMGDKDGAASTAREAKELFIEMHLDYEVVKLTRLGV